MQHHFFKRYANQIKSFLAAAHLDTAPMQVSDSLAPPSGERVRERGSFHPTGGSVKIRLPRHCRHRPDRVSRAGAGKRVSPHDTTSPVIDGHRVTVVYGRPYTKDPKTGEVRKIWGGLVPYGKVWRTGADEATLLTTEQPIKYAVRQLSRRGAYTLFTLPQGDFGTAKLIINKQIGQWGETYDEKKDLARIDLKKDTLGTNADQR